MYVAGLILHVECLVETYLDASVFLPQELDAVGHVFVFGVSLNVFDLLVVPVFSQHLEELVHIVEREAHSIVDQLLVEVHDHLFVLQEGLSVFGVALLDV